MKYKTFITETVNQAAKMANDNFGKVSSINKPEDNNQVLTQTDLDVGQFIISQIQKEYPTFNIIDEEAGVMDKGSDYTWVIDPIDGTSNFASGVETYGIMLGLLEKSTPIAGGIALPYFEELYVAEKGFGTYCNEERIYASKETELLKSLAAYGIDGHQENPAITKKEIQLMEEIVLNIRNLRTAGCVFDLIMVAKGRYGGLVKQTSKIWDNIAQQIIAEEAGCLYTDLLGNPMDYSNPLSKYKDNFTYCAAPKQLHEKLQEIIKRHY